MRRVSPPARHWGTTGRPACSDTKRFEKVGAAIAAIAIVIGGRLADGAAFGPRTSQGVWEPRFMVGLEVDELLFVESRVGG